MFSSLGGNDGSRSTAAGQKPLADELRTAKAVSYTHLDVYKRQSEAEAAAPSKPLAVARHVLT